MGDGLRGERIAMGRLVAVLFRGEERDVEIDFDGGYEADTNAHEIQWHFHGMTPEEHDALRITDEEEQSVYEQIARCLDGY
jgi:hypothetical protein